MFNSGVRFSDTNKITLFLNTLSTSHLFKKVIYFIQTRAKLIITFFLITMVAYNYGCGGDGDAVVVDFSKTVAVERPISPDPGSARLRVAVAAIISPKETFVYYRQLLDYIGSQLGREIEFIQRKTYGEINELLSRGQIDIAFICSGPYVNGKEKYGFELLATPEVQKGHFYQSYLIVNSTSQFYRLADLRGQIFAFTDPESNSGKLVPTFWISQMAERPQTFFSKIIYTYSHDNSILAVAKALVDGAAVDGLIWEYYNRKNSVFTAKTRIIRKSEPYGIPPIVASPFLAPDLKDRIREVIFSMHREPRGQKILNELMIDRFTPSRDEWYDSIRNMALKIASLEN
jgi:phosphonate transport system substrate-binding protein